MENRFILPADTDFKLGEALQAFSDLVATLDQEGTILEVRSNDPSLQEASTVLLNKRLHEIIPSPRANALACELLATPSIEKSTSFEFSLFASGNLRWFEARLLPVRPSQFILTAREITKYKRAEVQYQQQLQRLSALRSIDLAIASGLDLDLLLSMLLDQVTTLMQVDAAAILLYERESNLLKFASGKGFRTNVLQHTRLKIGEGYSGRVALERKMIHIPNLAKHGTGFDRSPLFSNEDFVTYYGVPLIAKGRVLGVLEIFHRSRLQPDAEWLDFLNIIAGQAAIAIDSASMFKELQKSNIELSMAYNDTIEGWSRTLDLRDRETKGHTRRVTDLTVRLVTLLGVNDSELLHIRRGAILHDIGKVAIPDHIIFKPGPLTPEEWEIMRQHPKIAVDLLSPINYLAPALEIPHYHHEKWDGSGYPEQLAGESIPFSARLFALADVFDALTSDRPYRRAWSKYDAIEYIKKQAGKHFDPRIVPEFLKLIHENGR